MNNNLTEWAQRHGVSREALIELADLLDYKGTDIVHKGDKMSEAAVQQRVELELSKQGVRVWRNNVGACVDDRGNHVRYGLANKSQQQNRVIKSSDLIGITPITVTPEMVGSTVGVFTAIECKHANWKWKGDAHELAQLKFINVVKSLGGIGGFTNGYSATL